MKIDKRLMSFLSSDCLTNLIGQANKLSENEGKVVRIDDVDGWRYEVAILSNEISAFPLRFPLGPPDPEY